MSHFHSSPELRVDCSTLQSVDYYSPCRFELGLTQEEDYDVKQTLTWVGERSVYALYLVRRQCQLQTQLIRLVLAGSSSSMASFGVKTRSQVGAKKRSFVSLVSYNGRTPYLLPSARAGFKRRKAAPSNSQSYTSSLVKPQ